MQPLLLEDSVRISADVVFREIDGEAVILDLGSGIYFGLNEVGTRIWVLLQQDGSLRKTFDALQQQYQVPPDRLEQDLLDLVRGMLEKGLLLEPISTPA